DDLTHRLYHEGRMLTGGRLRAEHDRVGAFQHGIGDIGDLAAVGFYAVDHALHHLGGNDHRFGAVDTFADDLALGHRDLFDGQFHAEVTTSYHHPVGLVDDVAKVFHGRGHLDLCDDLAAAFSVGQAPLQVNDVVHFADEGKGDPVHFLGDDEIEIDQVFFG